jgi:hypothetical protein
MRENEAPTAKQINYYAYLVRTFIPLERRKDWARPADLASKIIISERITAFREEQNQSIIEQTQIGETETLQKIGKLRKLDLEQKYNASNEELEMNEDCEPDEPKPRIHKYRTFV